LIVDKEGYAMGTPENVEGLVEEYRGVLEQAATASAGGVEYDSDKKEKLLIQEGERTPRAAEHLLKRSNDYGSFMLRNALALSLALKIEECDLGF
jgi:hypothetical protein